MIERFYVPRYELAPTLIVPCVQVGLGSIGKLVVRKALECRPWIHFVGAVDPRYAGRSLAEVVEWHEPLKVGIAAEPMEVRRVPLGAIAIHTTTSRLRWAMPDLLQLIARGWHVVSSMEELFFAQAFHSDLAKQLDEAARAHGVTLLGTGVNPGFVMDVLPLTLARVCTRVERVLCRRIVDLSTRREPLQRKIGLGLSEEEFYEGVQNQQLGHVGLVESAAALAHGLGWQLQQIRETIQPVLAQEAISIPALSIPKGRVQGMKQQATGFLEGREVIQMELEMLVLPKQPRDEVQIEGEPSFRTFIPGGISGDLATVGALLRGVERVRHASPGLILAWQ